MKSLFGVNYEAHAKCPSCMLGKATLEDYPSARIRKVHTKLTWTHFLLRLNLLKDTIILLFLSTISQGIDGFME